MQDMPYFMTNSQWYEFDAELGKLVLTDKAPETAIGSYKEFYQAVKED